MLQVWQVICQQGKQLGGVLVPTDVQLLQLWARQYTQVPVDTTCTQPGHVVAMVVQEQHQAADMPAASNGDTVCGCGGMAPGAADQGTAVVASNDLLWLEVAEYQLQCGLWEGQPSLLQQVVLLEPTVTASCKVAQL